MVMAPQSDDRSALQAPSTVQSGATLSTGQEALLQGYMMDNAAAVRSAPAARPALVKPALKPLQILKALCLSASPNTLKPLHDAYWAPASCMTQDCSRLHHVLCCSGQSVLKRSG